MSRPLDLLTKAIVVMKTTTTYMKDGTFDTKVKKKVINDIIEECEKAVLEGVLDTERMHMEYKEGEYNDTK